jgi:hypothetical protein
MSEAETDLLETSLATAEPPPAQPAERPADVPEKFWDPALGGIRTDALLKSYLELERKLGASRESGAGSSPTGYAIRSSHPLLEQDPALDARLLGAGFSEAQAQLVYDLAAERLLPMLQDALGEIEARQQVDRLQQHFGGAETWQHTARQMKGWASAHLDPATYAALAGSYEGVLALHQMMRASEPELLAGGESASVEIDEGTLNEMVRDPRYWRQRDPDFIARVTAGFKKLFAG